jgi:hypothetical protein
VHVDIEKLVEIVRGHVENAERILDILNKKGVKIHNQHQN